MVARLLVLVFSALLLGSVLDVRPGWGDDRDAAPAASLDLDALADVDADTGNEVTVLTPVDPPDTSSGRVACGAAAAPGNGRHHACELFRPPRSSASR
jgi:hypothetical protein